MDFLIKRHNIFNKSDSDCSDEHIQEINEEYVRALAEFHEVDFDKFKQLQDDVQNLKEYGSKLAQDVEQLEAENTVVILEFC